MHMLYCFVQTHLLFSRQIKFHLRERSWRSRPQQQRQKKTYYILFVEFKTDRFHSAMHFFYKIATNNSMHTAHCTLTHTNGRRALTSEPFGARVKKKRDTTEKIKRCYTSIVCATNSTVFVSVCVSRDVAHVCVLNIIVCFQ